jgi:hypothetical protein
MSRREELEKKGWTKRFTAGEPRLSEAVEEYQELGFEVLLEPFDPQERNGECASCLLTGNHRYETIYTRPKMSPKVLEKYS